MKILSINTGSSSLKFKLYQMPDEEVLMYGYVENIGKKSNIKITTTKTYTCNKQIASFKEAITILLEFLKQYDLSNIDAIGHRIVNGKDHIYSEEITKDVLNYLKSIKDLSKVHMEGHIAAIEAFNKVLPNVRQFASYDTSFHRTIPKENYIYPVPYKWYQDYGIRKYGFHGISNEYIVTEMEQLLNKKVNLIVCHIGYGASVTAIEKSKSLDTSMGFTASDGLMMATRCGTIDWSIIPYLVKKGISLKQIEEDLSFSSGLSGICGFGDNRLLEEKKDDKCILALDMYVKTVVDYIAKYYIRLEKIDGIVFCGGVGENDILFRKKVLEKLQKLGIFIDNRKNNSISRNSLNKQGIITTNLSITTCYVIPTDEELMIARKTFKQIKKA